MARKKIFKLSVLGRSCDFSKRVVEIATPIILKKTLSARMINTIELRIELRATELNKECHGIARNIANGSAVKRSYGIVIQRDLSVERIIEVLIHELAHIAQYATNRLQHRVWQSDRQMHVRWNGREMGVHNSIPYALRPWEIEAVEMQNTHLTAVRREVRRALGLSSLDYAMSKYAS